MAARGYRTIPLVLRDNTQVSVRASASARVADALEEIVANATLYEGVRLTQVLEAAYRQGTKDGARVVFAQLDDKLDDVKRQIPHRAPGRPKKRPS